MFGKLRARVGYYRSIMRSMGGVHPRECPICEYAGMFCACGSPPRWDAECPKCGSLERHRLLALYLHRNPMLLGDTVHFAPESGMAKIIRRYAERYRSADLFNPAALKLNIEAIGLPNESVDTFVTSHVLEHVEDRKALAELYRCLRPGGSAIIMVPLVEGWPQTHENPAATSPSARDLHFGQSDHVRYYGRDVRDRIREAGFSLAEFTASGDDCAQFGLHRGETVFVATKLSDNLHPKIADRRSDID